VGGRKRYEGVHYGIKEKSFGWMFGIEYFRAAGNYLL